MDVWSDGDVYRGTDVPQGAQKVDCGILSVSPGKNGARTINTLWFRAATWDPQAVFWWPSGPPT